MKHLPWIERLVLRWFAIRHFLWRHNLVNWPRMSRLMTDDGRPDADYWAAHTEAERRGRSS